MHEGHSRLQYGSFNDYRGISLRCFALFISGKSIWYNMDKAPNCTVTRFSNRFDMTLYEQYWLINSTHAPGYFDMYG